MAASSDLTHNAPSGSSDVTTNSFGSGRVWQVAKFTSGRVLREIPPPLVVERIQINSMSTQVKALPPWKVALIEKKRRHEEEDRIRQKEEEERLTQMPSWKRDILLKKQQQKNSLVYFAKPAHNSKSEQQIISNNQETISNHSVVSETSLNISNHEEQVSVVNHDSVDCGPPVKAAADTIDRDDSSLDMMGPSEEHIIPIQQNPWLKTDIQQRRHFRHSPRPSSGSDFDYSKTNSLPRNHGSASWHEPDDTNDGEEILDDEQEVAYGRGFVHKLLKKFKHLSARDEKTGAFVTGVVPKRAHSSENILEDASGSDKSSPRHHSSSQVRDGHPSGIYSSPGKARSMENLAGVKNPLSHLDVKTSSERRDSSQSSLDGSFSSGGMQSPRSRVSSQGDDATIHFEEEELPSTKLPIPNDTSTIEEPDLSSARKFGSSENLIEDELPRANIVSATRSIFENVSGTLMISKTKRKAPSPRSDVSDHVSGEHTNSSNRDISDTSLPNGSATQSELASSSASVAYTSGLGGEDGDGVSVRTDSSQINGNDRNANYKSDNRSVLAETRTGNGPAVAGSKVDQSSFGRSTNAVQESKVMPSQSIMQRNFKNNDLSQSGSNKTSDILPSDKGSIQAENNLANDSKKRRAPLPPSSSRSEVGVNSGTRDASIDPKSQTKKPSLFLDFNNSESRTPKSKTVSDPPSYRDLYFSSSGSKNEPAPAQEEREEEKGPLDVGDAIKNGSSKSVPVSVSEPSEKTSAPPTSTVGKQAEPMKPITVGSSTTTTKTLDPPKPKTEAPSIPPVVPQQVKPNKPVQSSKPANGHAASLTLPIPKAGEVPLNNKVTITRKAKRPVAPSSGSKSGSLLIRPASNLVPQSANTNQQFANIKKYDDVKSGVFQPPKSNPSYLSGLEDEFDIIPVTNIDDVIDDVPVTNIDDITGLSPRLEQDADNERKILSSRYDFIGAGVKTSRSLLMKNRTNKVRIFVVSKSFSLLAQNVGF